MEVFPASFSLIIEVIVGTSVFLWSVPAPFCRRASLVLLLLLLIYLVGPLPPDVSVLQALAARQHFFQKGVPAPANHLLSSQEDDVFLHYFSGTVIIPLHFGLSALGTTVEEGDSSTTTPTTLFKAGSSVMY